MTSLLQAQELEKAIRNGNVDKAMQMAQVLALVKAPVIVKVEEFVTDFVIDVDAIESSCSAVRLKENTEGSQSTMPLMVDPTMTFADLKNQIHERLCIVPANQVSLTTENHVPGDEESLDDAEPFVYRLNAFSDPRTKFGLEPIETQDVLQNFGGPSKISELVLNDTHVSPDVTQHLQLVADDADARSQSQPSWSCSACTYENHYALENCELCETWRGLVDDCMLQDIDQNAEVLPATGITSNGDLMMSFASRPVQAMGRTSEKGYTDLVAAEFAPMIRNNDPFECAICFSTIERDEGVTLRDCLHNFCVTCLTGHISHCENAVVLCPFNDGNYRCQSALQDREVRALVPDSIYEQYLRLSSREAEGQSSQSFHCKTPDCPGWCIVEDDVTMFFCYCCNHTNCISCKIIHEGKKCDEYQKKIHEEMQRTLANDIVKELGDALTCPKCKTVIVKADGCDWICCTVCKTEICWVTKQARWGPNGKGDTSGGCRCGVKGKLCHPKCQNCH